MTHSVEDGQLFIDGECVQTRFPVLLAVALSDVVVVVLDPDANLGGSGTFANLIAYDSAGSQRWIAQTPTTNTGDCFLSIESVEPLTALSWSGFLCTVDPLTGTLIDRQFVK
jgi:hypothetical protein